MPKHKMETRGKIFWKYHIPKGLQTPAITSSLWLKSHSFFVRFYTMKKLTSMPHDVANSSWNVWNAKSLQEESLKTRLHAVKNIKKRMLCARTVPIKHTRDVFLVVQSSHGQHSQRIAQATEPCVRNVQHWEGSWLNWTKCVSQLESTANTSV